MRPKNASTEGPVLIEDAGKTYSLLLIEQRKRPFLPDRNLTLNGLYHLPIAARQERRDAQR